MKRLRYRKGLTQEQLAEKLGITPRYVQHLEGVNCPNVKIETIAAIAKIVRANPKEFFED
ncbi:MAG: helix-turn-helix transcriptional regulator [Bdellovibrionia bacterium]